MVDDKEKLNFIVHDRAKFMWLQEIWLYYLLNLHDGSDLTMLGTFFSSEFRGKQ